MSNSNHLELIKLKYRLDQLEESLQVYGEKLQSLDLLDIEIDREQVQKHLKYLDYKVKDGNNIYLTFSYHQSDPRQAEGSVVKLSRFNWEKLEKQQSKGRNVSVVVNGHKGGYGEEEIKKFVGIFCQWENVSTASEPQPWQEVGFVEPTFSVAIGELSCQSYWLFNSPLKNQEKWQELQEKLLQLMKITSLEVNRSQSFYLAGSWYIKPKLKPILIEICQESGQKYDLEQLQESLSLET